MALGPGTSELTPTIVDPPRMPMRSATVRKQFDRRAPAFARHDFLVREVGRRMQEKLEVIRLAPRRVLDVGCGLGGERPDLMRRYAAAEWIGVDQSLAMLQQGAVADRSAATRLARLWRRPRAHWIAADAGMLPLADGCIDLVFSNLMLHWHPVPHTLFPEWKRVLSTGGLLMFSCFGPDTIKELRAEVAAILPRAVPMTYVDMHDFGDMMVAAGFATPVMDAERIRLTYANPADLLRDVAAMGGNPRDDRSPGFVSGRRARALIEALAARRDDDGRIGITFEVAYGHAWKPADRGSERQTRISVDSLRAQLRSR
ncbi:MAG: methyltransferase domain-containing protein [Gemmatimonadota bacterium]